MEYILHIGLHKTGTTAIQVFLQRNIETLQKHGVDFYQGLVFPENHVELHAASMRPERESGYKIRAGLHVDAGYIDMVRARVAAFVDKSMAKRIIFSSEGLSLLRYADEMATLKSLMPSGDIKILVFLREPNAYIRSYEAQLKKSTDSPAARQNKDSFAYTGPNTWLLDYETRLDGFRAVFGEKAVSVGNYDNAMLHHGNIIPAFLDELRLAEVFNPEDWQKCFFNETKAD